MGKKLHALRNPKNDTITVMEEITHEEVKYNSELQHAPFVKLFLKDLAGISGISKLEHDVMLFMLEYMDTNNVVVLSTLYKKQFAEKNNVLTTSINTAIYRLCNKNIFKSLNQGTYQGNPKFFGFGSWKNIKKVTIEYSEKSLGDILVERREEKK